MRKFFAVLAAITMLVLPVTVASPASADGYTPGCVTKWEFAGVQRGWTKARVHRRFEAVGRQTSYWNYGAPEQTREYRICSDWSWWGIEIDYQKRAGIWRVTYKSAIW